jgi:Na+/proline symporter
VGAHPGDSLLILASPGVVQDVVQKALGSGASERRLSMLGRGVTVVIGLVAFWVALADVRAIFYFFVLFAWSGIASAFTPVVLWSLFWKRTTRAGAVAGMMEASSSSSEAPWHPAAPR